MDQYFARMKDLSVNKELPSRIRFMLMDVIDLRDSKVRGYQVHLRISCFYTCADACMVHVGPLGPGTGK